MSTKPPIRPPATAPVPAPASVATIGPAAMIGPMPGIARPARLAAKPAPPPTTAPVTAPFAVALVSLSLVTVTRGSSRYSPVALLATMLMSLSRKPAARRSFATWCASLKLSNDPTIVLIMDPPLAAWLPSRSVRRFSTPTGPAPVRARATLLGDYNQRIAQPRSGRDLKGVSARTDNCPRLKHSDVRAGAVGKPFHAHRLGAVNAAEILAARLHAVTDDPALAMVASRREHVDRALEAVEDVRLSVHDDRERLVVAVSAVLADVAGLAARFPGLGLTDGRTVGGSDGNVAGHGGTSMVCGNAGARCRVGSRDSRSSANIPL